jgi:hypothetical protein
MEAMERAWHVAVAARAAENAASPGDWRLLGTPATCVRSA